MKKVLSFILALILILSLCATASAVEIPDGAYGVIWIPCLNIKMPVYIAEVDDHSYRQPVIDEEQSALINHWQTATYIMDHEFSEDGHGNDWDIQKIFSGAYAWLYTNEANYYLECYMTAKTEYDGNEYINGRLVTPCSSHDVMLSCCAEDVDHHFIAVFRRLREF